MLLRTEGKSKRLACLPLVLPYDRMLAGSSSILLLVTKISTTYLSAFCCSYYWRNPVGILYINIFFYFLCSVGIQLLSICHLIVLLELAFTNFILYGMEICLLLYCLATRDFVSRLSYVCLELYPCSVATQPGRDTFPCVTKCFIWHSVS